MCNPSATLKFAIPPLISDKTPAPTVQCWDVSGILGTDLIWKFAEKKKWCAPNTFPIDRTHRRNMPFEIHTSHFSTAPSLDSGGGFFDTIPNCKWNVAWGFVKHDNVITFFCTRLISAKNVFLFFFRVSSDVAAVSYRISIRHLKIRNARNKNDAYDRPLTRTDLPFVRTETRLSIDHIEEACAIAKLEMQEWKTTLASCRIRRGSSTIANKHPPFQNSACNNRKRRRPMRARSPPIIWSSDAPNSSPAVRVKKSNSCQAARSYPLSLAICENG